MWKGTEQKYKGEVFGMNVGMLNVELEFEFEREGEKERKKERECDRKSERERNQGGRVRKRV